MKLIAAHDMAAFDRLAISSYMDGMSKPLVFSILFHIAVFTLMMVGLPHIKPEVPLMETSITVEMVDEVDDVSRTTKPPEKAEDVPTPPPVPREKTDEPPPEKRAPPTQKSAAPPRPSAPVPPDVSDQVAAPRDAELMEPRETAAPQTAPIPPRNRPVMNRVTQKTPEEDQTEEDQDEAMNALLRNLTENQDDRPAPQPLMTGAAQDPAPARVPLGERMTISEQERLKEQLAMCWNVTAGARYAESLVVEVSLFMNPDRTVRDARIKDQFRYNRDSFFRAAADSALRAVRHPRCTPLLLPPEKYEQWKTINIVFDPREMLQ